MVAASGVQARDIEADGRKRAELALYKLIQTKYRIQFTTNDHLSINQISIPQL